METIGADNPKVLKIYSEEQLKSKVHIFKSNNYERLQLYMNP